jgi:fumarate hydratase class II
MNANEVIARVAGRGVHPNDHVNLGQSSNDVIPSAAHLSTLLLWERELRPALLALSQALRKKSGEFERVVKLGRTHLMDAVPIRLGYEFGAYARQIEKAAAEIGHAAQGLQELAIGGTAVGTGMNADPRFAQSVCRRLRRWTGLDLREAEDHFEAQGARDDLVRFSGALRSLAVALSKIANDIRWMASGPIGGLAEIRLPELQAGSSIMPGKVNPIIPEVVVQVAAQVIGQDAAVTWAGAWGQFELNAMIPLMVHNILGSTTILSSACRLFAARCISGIEADRERCAQLASQSQALVTALVEKVGYDRGAELAKEAREKHVLVSDLAVQKGILSRSEADRLFDLAKLSARNPGARPRH